MVHLSVFSNSKCVLPCSAIGQPSNRTSCCHGDASETAGRAAWTGIG